MSDEKTNKVERIARETLTDKYVNNYVENVDDEKIHTVIVYSLTVKEIRLFELKLEDEIGERSIVIDNKNDKKIQMYFYA